MDRFIQSVFGHIANGRLGRGEFAVAYAVWCLILFAVLLGLSILVGVAEPFIAGDLEAVWDTVGQSVALSLLVALAVMIGTWGFGAMNLLAKRFRDIGLPGWLCALATMFFLAGAPTLVALHEAVGLMGLIVLALCVVPADVLRMGDDGIG